MPKKLENEAVGKNCSFKMKNFMLVNQYQNKTKRGFSATLNKILEEWDDMSLELQKYKEREEEERIRDRFDTISQADALKEV